MPALPAGIPVNDELLQPDFREAPLQHLRLGNAGIGHVHLHRRGATVTVGDAGAYPFKTNGVTSPYPGITDSTVQLVKANRGKVLVDWVRITKNR